MTVEASASASVLEQALHTNLAEYSVDGRLLRLASGPLSVPASLTGTVLAISGVDQKIFKPAGFGKPGRETASKIAAEPSARPAKQTIEAPEWPLTPEPCSGFWGEKLDTTDPSLPRLSEPAALRRVRLRARAAPGRIRPQRTDRSWG